MTYKMKAKETGRLYSSRGRTKVICTGPGLTGEMFSGFVVAQSDPESGHPVGHYSTTWTKGAFEEGEGEETFNLDELGKLAESEWEGCHGCDESDRSFWTSGYMAGVLRNAGLDILKKQK
jgi:hypothetical protein